MKKEPNCKKNYLSPSFEIVRIEMEEGIAGTSATVNPGETGNPDIPKVEDWGNGGDYEGTGEI